MAKQRTNKKKISPLTAMLIVAGLGIGGYAVYKFVTKPKNSTDEPNKQLPNTNNPPDNNSGNNNGGNNTPPGPATVKSYPEGKVLYVASVPDTIAYGGAKRRDEYMDGNDFDKIPIGQTVGKSTGKIFQHNGITFQEVNYGAFWAFDGYVAIQYLTDKK